MLFDQPTTTSQLAAAVAVILGTLAVGTIIRLVMLRGADPQLARQRKGSLVTWWVLTTAVGLAALTGVWAAAVLIGAASVIGLWEFATITGLRRDRPWVVATAIVLAAAHYAVLAFGWVDVTRWLLPLAAPALLAWVSLVTGSPAGFVRSIGGLYWALIVLVYGLSHLVMLVSVADWSNPVAGSGGWFLFAILLTEINDIAQALTGRRFGKHRLTPVVSPNKTWEGFWGGLVGTLLAALVFAPLLTPLNRGYFHEDYWHLWPVPYLGSCMVGLLVTLFGLLGDLNMSAVKRDAGVKDSGRMLPGHGGMIDRIDSLTFTAPVLYYFISAFYL